MAGSCGEPPNFTIFKWGELAKIGWLPLLCSIAMARNKNRRRNASPTETVANNNNTTPVGASAPQTTGNHVTPPPSSLSSTTTSSSTQHYQIALAMIDKFSKSASEIYSKTMAVYQAIDKLKLFLQGDYSSYEEFLQNCMYIFFKCILSAYCLKAPPPPMPTKSLSTQKKIKRCITGYTVCIVIANCFIITFTGFIAQQQCFALAGHS